MKYLRILRDATIELKEKRSLFLGHCRLSRSEEEAKCKLRELVDRYRDATHNCWAYRVGVSPSTEYYSDAGEPSGSAGKPILGAIRRACVADVIVVVTRYFGGIKLGMRGLIETYGMTANLVLKAAGNCLFVPTASLNVVTSYEFQRKVFSMLKPFGISEDKAVFVYDETVSFDILVPLEVLAEVEDLFSNLSSSGQIISWKRLPIVKSID